MSFPFTVIQVYNGQRSTIAGFKTEKQAQIFCKTFSAVSTNLPCNYEIWDTEEFYLIWSYRSGEERHG